MTWPKVLPEATRQKILAEYSAGVKRSVIAKRYGVDINYPANLAKQRGLPSPTKQRIARGWERARRMAGGYDPQQDFARSIEDGYQAIRERVAAGGEPWRPGRE